MNDYLIGFINNTLASDEYISKATAGRIYQFESEQGAHVYPFIMWSIINTSTIATFLDKPGEARISEVQINVFTKAASVSAKIAELSAQAFNNAQCEGAIIDAYSNQIVQAYCDEDQTIQYAVRVFVIHKSN